MTETRRILVLESNDAARGALQTALVDAGYEVAPAANGRDAMRVFQQAGPFALVMLDLAVRDCDAQELCAQMREAGGELLPIVMLRGDEDGTAVARAYAAGATDFIAKPIDWCLLGYRVSHLLRVQQTVSELRTLEARHAAILQAIPDLLFELDSDGRYVHYHSPRTDPLGLSAEHVIGRTVHELLPEHAAKIFMSALAVAAVSGASTGKSFKLDLPQGAFWFELSVSRKGVEPGEQPRFIVLSRNITERMAAEYRIRKMAFFDSLTGLPNRAYFMRRLERHIRIALDTRVRFAILFMDLDGFKNINDTLGHGVGDRLLRAAAERLLQAMRHDDMLRRAPYKSDELQLARLGGDEFVSLVRHVESRDDVLVVTNRLLAVMRQPFQLDDRQVTLTTSIGVAVYPDDGHDPATLLKHGDTAMYHAKDSGRDNCQFYSATLTRHALRTLDLDESLRVAEERGELSLVYQPQVDVASESVHSVEALLRWQHPVHGEMPPLDFIPMAERNGLILPIGRWVLRAACRQAVAWQRSGRPARIAVNISALQWRDPDLVTTVFDALREAGLRPEHLELELTETAVMENTEATLAKLHLLRAQGVRIALDDFGTGYSSLSYLGRMPLTSLKIDRSFVAGLPDAPHNRAIVRAILAMARSLNLVVTAEGVETKEQANILHAMGCEVLQGFLFTEPVPAAEVPALLDRRWVPLPAAMRPQPAAAGPSPPQVRRARG